jgi:hypothetical protein
MSALAVLFFFGLYFVILILGTYFAYRFFKNRSRKLAIYSGTTVFLAIFLPVFWGWIPRIIAHDYYCKQAGFTEFKPVEQWKKENPGVWETLREYNSDERNEARKDREYLDYQGQRYKRYPINPRISIYTSTIWHESLLLSITTSFVYDEGKQEVLVMRKFSEFSAPGTELILGVHYDWSGFKIWLNNKACRFNEGRSAYRAYLDAMSNPTLEPNKNRQ